MKAFSKSVIFFSALAVLSAGSGLSLAAQSTAGGRVFSPFKGLVIKTAFQDSLPSGLTKRLVDGHGLSGSLDFRLTPNLSLVGSVTTSVQGMGSGDENMTRLSMVNVVYDIDTGNKQFRPFLNLGAGVATHNIYRGGITRLGIASESIADLAWGAGGGMNYMINDQLSLTGSYRYTASSSSEFLDKYDLGLNDHSVRMGVKYKLPARRIIDPEFRRD